MDDERFQRRYRYGMDRNYGWCRGCQSQEPVEVLRQMNGYCSSQCEREDRETRDG